MSPAILQDLYAVENLDELDTRMVSVVSLYPCRISISLTSRRMTSDDPAGSTDSTLGPNAKHFVVL